MFLAWITLKKQLKQNVIPVIVINYMSNSLLTKKFLSVNRKKKNHGLIQQNQY